MSLGLGATKAAATAATSAMAAMTGAVNGTARPLLLLLGAGLVLLSCVGVGRWGAARLRQRQQMLFGLGCGLSALLRDVGYLAAPLIPALEQAATEAGRAGELFRCTARLLRQGDGLTGAEAWLAAMQQTNVAAADRDALALVAAGLGQSDVERQLRQLELARQAAGRAEAEAQESCRKYGKLWLSLGWCGGLALVLLLL